MIKIKNMEIAALFSNYGLTKEFLMFDFDQRIKCLPGRHKGQLEHNNTIVYWMNVGFSAESVWQGTNTKKLNSLKKKNIWLITDIEY